MQTDEAQLGDTVNRLRFYPGIAARQQKQKPGAINRDGFELGREARQAFSYLPIAIVGASFCANIPERVREAIQGCSFCAQSTPIPSFPRKRESSNQIFIQFAAPSSARGDYNRPISDERAATLVPRPFAKVILSSARPSGRIGLSSSPWRECARRLRRSRIYRCRYSPG